jgi:hypothetical protein
MGDETNKRVCSTCVLCLRADYGYSNWTTEGMTFSCLAGLNPALDGQDEPYEPWREPSPELIAALDVALTCPKYREGVPAWARLRHGVRPVRRPRDGGDGGALHGRFPKPPSCS